MGELPLSVVIKFRSRPSLATSDGSRRHSGEVRVRPGVVSNRVAVLRSGSTKEGHRFAFSPITKKLACAPLLSSRSRISGVHVGLGPSSKVR